MKLKYKHFKKTIDYEDDLERTLADVLLQHPYR